MKRALIWLVPVLPFIVLAMAALVAAYHIRYYW
jgi:hypothetical protein